MEGANVSLSLGSDSCQSSNVSLNSDVDIFDQLSNIRSKYPKRFIYAYLNVYSIRYKICHIKEVLQKGIVDMLFLAETKLDQSFVDCQFKVDNYSLWRADRTANGGGLMIYLRSDIPGERKKQFEFGTIESIGANICNFDCGVSDIHN